MKSIKLILALFIGMLILSPTYATIPDISKVDIEVKDLRYYYISKYVKNGIWNTPYKVVDNNETYATEGDRIEVEVNSINKDEVRYNITVNYVSGFTTQNISIFGGWAIVNDMNYWLNVDNIQIYKQFLLEYPGYNYTLNHRSYLINDKLSYSMNFKIIEVGFEAKYRFTYLASDGSLLNMNYEIIDQFDETARYTRDQIRIRYGGYGFEPAVKEEKSKFPWAILAFVGIFITLIIVVKKNEGYKV